MVIGVCNCVQMAVFDESLFMDATLVWTSVRTRQAPDGPRGR